MKAMFIEDNMEQKRYGFTQPLCNACWEEKNPGRMPVTVKDSTIEKCCLCGNSTKDGIFIRIDPKTVPYPMEKT
jgi:hypothetical protein